MANITLQTEIKLTVEQVPDDPIEYPGWRFTLKSKILGLQLPTTFLFAFIASIDSKTFVVLGMTETDELYLALDAKLFSCIVEAVAGKANLKHAQAIETEVVLGKGRQALKLIDKAKGHEIEELVSRASFRLTTSLCTKDAELEAFIIQTK